MKYTVDCIFHGPKEMNSKDDNYWLHKGYVYPKLTKKILNKIEFKLKEDEISLMIERIKKRYGLLICLNEIHQIYLQYHGRFNSFLIGWEINPENENQPYQKLVRIDTMSGANYKEKSAFSNKLLHTKHIHWYNTILDKFVRKNSFNAEIKNKTQYNKIIFDLINDKPVLTKRVIKQAVPYDLFLKLNNETKGEDIQIQRPKILKETPEKIFYQILNRDLF